MKRQALEGLLRKYQCTIRSNKGPHTKWDCPCGKHSANVPRHNEISPGVVQDTVKRLACLPKGWIER